MWPPRTITKLAVILFAGLVTASARAQFVPFPGKQAIGNLGGGGNSARDCVADGGKIVSISPGEKICQFEAASCPAGWTQRNNWSTTTANTCSASTCSPCTTGSHSFANLPEETCSYGILGPLCLGLATCTAEVVRVGCQ